MTDLVHATLFIAFVAVPIMLLLLLGFRALLATYAVQALVLAAPFS